MNLTNHLTGEDHHQYKHGRARTPEHEAWRSMRQRCTNPNHRGYKNYGGRGIKICDRWLESFENFLADVGLKPSPKQSLDRYPNKDGNYEPGNVRWATSREQQNNLRSNFVVKYRGQEMTFTEAWRIAGSILPADTCLKRIYAGWSVDDALETPKGKRTRWKQS